MSSVGSFIWTEGIEVLNALQPESFLKASPTLSKGENDGLALIGQLLNSNTPFSRDNFIATGHFHVRRISKLYKYIQELAETSQIRYSFSNEDDGDFIPWKNEVDLGKKFYTVFENQIRIPFYSYNHDNAHLALFGKYYSDINISDSDLSELFILIEWFCISLDLILAYDLIKSESYACLTELNTIANRNAGSLNSVFFQQCTSIAKINSFADEFKSAFLSADKNEIVESLIADEVLKKHRSFSQNNLVPCCRKIRTTVSVEEAQELILLLKTYNLTDIINQLTGIVYGD